MSLGQSSFDTWRSRFTEAAEVRQLHLFNLLVVSREQGIQSLIPI